MVNDARTQTKTWLDTYITRANLNWDVGSRQLEFTVMWVEPDYPIEFEFVKGRTVDLIYGIGEPDTTPLVGHDKTIVGYEEQVPITIYCVDKDGRTGTKIKWQAEAELRSVAENYPLGSIRLLKRRESSDLWLGSDKVYRTTWLLSYRRDPT